MIKSIKQFVVLTGIVAMAFVLAGCLESPDIISYEPGVYQGMSDPLIANSDSDALQKRFANQMDR